MDIINLDREITEDDYPEKFLMDEREDDESESSYSMQSDVNHNLVVPRKRITTADSCFSANDNGSSTGKEIKRLIGSGAKDSAKKEESVLVVVRCRPMSEKEKLQGHSQVVEMWPEEGVVLIRNPKDDHKERVKTFTFDAVYDWNSTQQDLYDEMVRPLVESVLNGFNATIFAYGQTGTGKTYTMEGCRSSPGGTDERGVIPKSFEQIFTHISRTTDKQHLIRASYLEIYQEEVRDLLDKDPKKRYELRESKDIGVYVKDLQSFVCKSVKEIEQVMNIGNKNRTIGATNMNEHSSRSHAIFMITIEMSDVNPTTKSLVKVGKLNLVDLAGSERQTKTGASGNRLKEASKINLSLSALGNVISALVDDKCQHVPYRDSKLTRLLQDSLGGNSKTLMVANIGPASYNYDESLTTLRYANRAKNIQNKPRVNEDPKDALIRQYQEEIERLKELLYERMQKSKKKYSGGGGGGGAIETFDNFEKEQYFQREEDKLDEKKASILRAENITDEEMQRQLRAVEEKRRLIAEERKYSQDLLEKIKSMESKLLQGGKNIIDHTNQQQKDLERRMAEIREKKQHAYQMQKRLDEAEEAAQSVRVSYSNLLEEVEAKKKQLNKLITKYQRVKQEIADNEEEHNQNRRELELSQKEILKEIKLRQLIIDNFIPPEERRSTEERLFYDEDDNGWQLMPDDSISRLKDRPIATAGVRRPTTQYTLQQAKVCNNPRFKCENLILLDLDYPERCTKSYEPSLVLSSLRLRLEDVLRNDEDLLIDTSKLLRRPRIPVPIGYNSRSGKSYPQARGLVPK